MIVDFQGWKINTASPKGPAVVWPLEATMLPPLVVAGASRKVLALWVSAGKPGLNPV